MEVEKMSCEFATKSVPRTEPSRWSPYIDNGGTVIAACGKDFAAAVCDTRMSSGYRIMTRNMTKICKLTDQCVLCSAGMQAEILTLQKVLKMRISHFEHLHRKKPSTPAIAQMLSTVLYSKRFFPYYTFNCLIGTDSAGVGGVYQYDAVGSFDRMDFAAAGSGESLVLSILDNKIAKNNQVNPERTPLTKEETLKVLDGAIQSATERDIHTGDFAEFVVVTKDGVEISRSSLRKD